MTERYGDWNDWFLCFVVALFLSGDMLVRKVFTRIAESILGLSPLRKAFAVFSLLAIPAFLSAAYAEQAANALTPRGSICWFTAAAANAIFLFWVGEELTQLRAPHRLAFLIVAGILIAAFFHREVGWVMAAADDAAQANEIKEARDCFNEVLQRRLYLAVIAKPSEKQEPPQISPPPRSRPNLAGGSLLSPDEPSERAVLRVVAIKTSIEGDGLMFKATIYVQNVGKFIVLPFSMVRSALKRSLPLHEAGEAKLFDDAPDLDTKNHRPNGVDWQRGGSIVPMQPWYPGDVKSLTVEGFVSPPGQEAADFQAGDRGWYVLTRAFFRDKIGVLPYRDSCTYFSVKVPNGGRCWNHND